jgi:hypothetical protein
MVMYAKGRRPLSRMVQGYAGFVLVVYIVFLASAMIFF